MICAVNPAKNRKKTAEAAVPQRSSSQVVQGGELLRQVVHIAVGIEIRADGIAEKLGRREELAVPVDLLAQPGGDAAHVALFNVGPGIE